MGRAVGEHPGMTLL